MKFKINHIEYETEETNIKLIEFLKNNKLSFINNNLLKVEIENNEQLQNIKDVIIEDGMSLLTISDKIIDKLNSEIQTISKQVQQDEFKLSETCYNVLLCDSDIYEESLKLYSNCGFDDIINIKFASMIEFVERANEMLIKKTITEKIFDLPILNVQGGTYPSSKINCVIGQVMLSVWGTITFCHI